MSQQREKLKLEGTSGYVDVDGNLVISASSQAIADKFNRNKKKRIRYWILENEYYGQDKAMLAIKIRIMGRTLGIAFKIPWMKL